MGGLIESWFLPLIVFEKLSFGAFAVECRRNWVRRLLLCLKFGLCLGLKLNVSEPTVIVGSAFLRTKAIGYVFNKLQ